MFRATRVTGLPIFIGTDIDDCGSSVAKFFRSIVRRNFLDISLCLGDQLLKTVWLSQASPTKTIVFRSGTTARAEVIASASLNFMMLPVTSGSGFNRARVVSSIIEKTMGMRGHNLVRQRNADSGGSAGAGLG
jgi:methylaspartate ammonia-lyase